MTAYLFSPTYRRSASRINMTALHAVSLFAGIGGIDLALKRAGIPTVVAVEIDPAARGVLADRMPQTILLHDVTEVTGDRLRDLGFDPARGIITAGWPCQGNSVAGHRQGMDDPRSGLWVHVARLLAELRPRWFLGENVPGLLSVNDGRDIAVVRADLAQLGYWWAERILDAQHFGVPQRRRRVFIVGHSRDRAAPVQVLLEPEGGGGNSAPRRAAGSGVANGTAVSTLQGGGKRGHRLDAEAAAGGHLVPVSLAVAGDFSSSADIAQTVRAANGQPGTIAIPLAVRGREGGSQLEWGEAGEPYNALRSGNGGSSRTPLIFHENQRGEVTTADTAGALKTGGGKPGQGYPAVMASTAVRRLTPTECERLQGFPDGWTATSNGLAQSDSARYRQLGNAVAVPCVEWTARRIAAVEAAS